MTVRPLRLEDAPVVAVLAGQLGYPSTTEDIERRFRLLDGSPLDALFGVETEEAVLVGWVHVQRHHSLELDPYALVVALVVDERFRGSGVGRALLEATEQWARDHGLTGIRVRSNITRERTHRFYEQRGYRNVKTSHVFHKELI
jgi:GNAT superfamily N-acetyltransferase